MEKIISAMLSFLLCFSAIHGFAAFTDIDENTMTWAGEAIEALQNAEIINGYEDGTFRPGNNVTRAEFAKMLCIAFDFEYEPGKREFKDIENHWAESYIQNSENYVYAPSFYYYPDNNATRAEIAYALARASNLTLTYDLTETNNIDSRDLAELLADVAGWKTAEGNALERFTDADTVYSDMVVWVAAAVDAGLITGYEDSTIRGNNPVTRAEAAVLIFRAMNYKHNSEEDQSDNNTDLTDKPVAGETVLPDTESGNSSGNTETGDKTQTPPESDGPGEAIYDQLLEKGHIYTLYPQKHLLLISSSTKMYDENDEEVYKLKYYLADTGDEYESVVKADTVVSGICNGMDKLKKGDVVVLDTGFWGEIGCLYVLTTMSGNSESSSEYVISCPESWSVYPGENEYEIIGGVLENVEMNTKSCVLTLKTENGNEEVTVPRSVGVDIYDNSAKRNNWENDSVSALYESENTYVFIRFSDGKVTEVVAGK